jgi:p90 ribosomal S6 kinase
LAFETTSHVFIVTELLSGGDLYFRLDEMACKGQEGFQEDVARIVVAEIALGIVHLHKMGFLHLDMKIENVMIDRAGHTKIIDFGLAVEIPAGADNDEGFKLDNETTRTLLYTSPEMLTQHIVGRFSDWWSLGVLTHELFTGRSPWSTLTDKAQIRKEIRTHEVDVPEGVNSGRRIYAWTRSKRSKESSWDFPRQ